MRNHQNGTRNRRKKPVRPGRAGAKARMALAKKAQSLDYQSPQLGKSIEARIEGRTPKRKEQLSVINGPQPNRAL